MNQATTLRQKSDSSAIFNTHAECSVNNSQGNALLEFQYYEDKSECLAGECYLTKLVVKSFAGPIKLRQLPSLLAEKKVETLPQHFVVNIKSETAKVLEITGGKGNSLALLKSLASREVPETFQLWSLIFIINLFF